MCENALAWTFHQFLLGRCKLVCGKVGKARDRQRVRNRPLVTGLTYLATYQLVPSRDKTGETPGLAGDSIDLKQMQLPALIEMWGVDHEHPTAAANTGMGVTTPLTGVRRWRKKFT